jgi:RNA methyltransferase, TrmH family
MVLHKSRSNDQRGRHGPDENRRKSRPGPASGRARSEAVRTDTVRICGLPAVRALEARTPEAILRLFFDEATAPLVGDMAGRLAERRRPYRLVGADELAKVAGTAMHGGIVAVIPARAVPPFDVEAAVARAAADGPLLILDGVGNPHNLGAIARSAAFFGIRRLVLSDNPAQALPSEAAYRVSEGGLFHLEVTRATDLPRVLRRLAATHRVVGTALGRGAPFAGFGADPRPVALVMGNEEQGLGRRTLDACAEIATLPGSGAVQSLNVAATAAILLWELGRGR